mmetsp:Transcript_52726/g.118350  ORF Transcript_52726/g.118350 Transcript_52726/m.118350 type:complete len:179 (-) Transcript_52726:40-576(-)
MRQYSTFQMHAAATSLTQGCTMPPGSIGLEIDTRSSGRPASTRWLRCDERAEPSASDVGVCSAPSGACSAGPAANIFVTHGGDDDFALDVEEAAEAEAALREVLRRKAARCVLPGTARATNCFTDVVTKAVGVLTRAQYQSAWLPCVLKGLREECRLHLCQDPCNYVNSVMAPSVSTE